MRPSVAALALACLPLATGDLVGQDGARPSSCIACHTLLGDESVTHWPADVHAEAGLGCEACHGGDPSPALADDMEAMSEDNGFRPLPDRLAVADFCAGCHSDLAFMRQYNPQARVDQLTEYRESKHGRRNAEGDPVPATCTDCHGAHGIRLASRPDSPVYATNVPKTCGTCHADADKMAAYGLPSDQVTLYRRSMHGIALLEGGDIGAPACNDCHGNHGAAPPGISSVASVCGQCHGREAKLFRESFKKEIFDALGASECTECHGSHRVLHPTPAMIYGDAAPRVSQGDITSVDPFTAELGRIEAGQSATVAWSVTLSPHARREDPALGHRVVLTPGESGPLEIDASVIPGDSPSQRTLSVSSTAMDATLRMTPMSGEPVRAGDSLFLQLEIRANVASKVALQTRPGTALQPVEGSVCLACHAPGDECDQATVRMYEGLAALDRELREAEHRLHQAEISGMLVNEPLFRINSDGTTAAIESRALVHGFVPERLLERTDQGRVVAADGLAAALAAMQELQFRRKGLAVSLVLVALVLVALYLKIRQVDRDRRRVAPR